MPGGWESGDCPFSDAAGLGCAFSRIPFGSADAACLLCPWPPCLLSAPMQLACAPSRRVLLRFLALHIIACQPRATAHHTRLGAKSQAIL